MRQYIFRLFSVIVFVLLVSGCKKLVKVGEPVNSLTTSEVFSTDANATSAVSRIYNDMIIGFGGGPFGYANCYTTFLAGLSADELMYSSSGPEMLQFQNNTLLSSNASYYNSMWVQPYQDIYLANAAIEGLAGSSTLSAAIKTQLLGESKFLRAYIYFYLVNLYGDVPLLTSTSWSSEASMRRTPQDQVYKQITDDLKDAQSLLKDGYSFSGGERIRVNRSAANALLARVDLYLEKWSDAVTQASAVIANNDYVLENDLNNVFLKTSKEAIWQLEINEHWYPYATTEGNKLIPEYLTKDYPQDVVNSHADFFVPQYYLRDGLLSAFEPGDQRMQKWIDTTGVINGIKYYYPFKYKVRMGNDGSVSEYYTMLRLAEQYLIRAEAYARQNKLDDAINDLNVIRLRAGLSNLPSSTDQGLVLAAVAQENRVEYFAEWGHRWLDLKRTKQADIVLGPLKGSKWQSTDQLWPIPLSEIQLNPNLTQNAGY